MKKIPASLLKYVFLLLALVVTTLNLLYHVPGKTNLLIMLLVFAGIYIFLSVSEFLAQVAKSELPYDRFAYLPFSVISNKVIKLGALTIVATVLLLSKSAIVYLGVLVLILLVADLLVFVLRLTKSVYYVSLFANYILFALEDETKIFASQIEIIEYRYEIFYIQTKQNKTYPIEVARLPRSEQAGFIDKFVLWVVCNKLNFTPEAKEKLADIISETL